MEQEARDMKKIIKTVFNLKWRFFSNSLDAAIASDAACWSFMLAEG